MKPRHFNHLRMTAVKLLCLSALNPNSRNNCGLVQFTLHVAVHIRCGPNTFTLTNTSTEHLVWIFVGEIKRVIKVINCTDNPSFFLKKKIHLPQLFGSHKKI